MSDTENKIEFSGTFGESIGKINAFLKKYEPHNWGKDHKSYSGYKPQWIIDAVNTEFAGQWKVESLQNSIYVSPKDKKEHAFVQVRVTFIGFLINGHCPSMEAFASHPNNQNDIGDAYKSAQTDAMKKALSHFSIGNRAYHGLLK